MNPIQHINGHPPKIRAIKGGCPSLMQEHYVQFPQHKKHISQAVFGGDYE